MKQAYNRRPHDFKRRLIISKLENKIILLENETKYLQMIKEEELGKKYYNLHRNDKFGFHSISDEMKKEAIFKRKNRIVSVETRQKLSLAGKGKKRTKETKEKISNAKKGIPLSENHKNNISLKRRGILGKKHSEETKIKLSLSHTGKKLSVEHKEKLSNSHKGKHKTKPFYVNGEFFNSIKECVEKTLIPQTTVLYRLRSKNFKEYYYK